MPINIGTWKYYWETGVLKDSIIYNEGNQIYKASFHKKGKLVIEKHAD